LKEKVIQQEGEADIKPADIKAMKKIVEKISRTILGIFKVSWCRLS